MKITTVILLCFFLLSSNLFAQYESPIMQQDYVYDAKEVSELIKSAAKTKQERIIAAFEKTTGTGLREAFSPYFADLYLGRNLDKVNQELQEILTTDDIEIQRKFRIDDHWCLVINQQFYHMYYNFGSKSKLFPGRLYPETEKALLEVLWERTKYRDDMYLTKKSTWWMIGSENHDLEAKVTNLIAAQIFMDEPDFKDRIYPDLGKGGGYRYWFHQMYGKTMDNGLHGRANEKDGNNYTAEDHYHAWVDYFDEYFKERIKKGFFLEVASPGYMGTTMSYLTDIYDLCNDEKLRHKAEDFLDVAWVEWAQEQLLGVRGGAKTRETQSTRWQGSMYRFARFYTGGDGEGNGHGIAQLMSDYNWKPIIWHIALDSEGRGEYAAISRKPGEEKPVMPRPLGTEFSLLCDTKSRLLHYSWITPDYIMGCQMDHPLALHSHSSVQDRWLGVTFKGDNGPRVFPTALKLDNNGEYTWDSKGYCRCVQDKNVMIVQQSRGFAQLSPDWFPEKSRLDLKYGVYFGKNLGRIVEKDGWIFVEHGDAYVAVRVLLGEYYEGWSILKDPASPGLTSEIFEESYEWSKNREMIYLKDKFSGMIFETSRRAHHSTLEDFMSDILKTSIELVKTVVPGFHTLTYESTTGTKFVFNLANNEIPTINGEYINYEPDMVFDSPFLKSKYNSGKVTIKYKDKRMTLDFVK